jgi:hypothetical protein
LLALALLIGVTSLAPLLATAQPPSTAPYVQYIPVAPAPLGASDPYATSPFVGGGVSPTGWFPNGGMGLPMVSSMQDRVWLRGEYLQWWTAGMQTPPLVTTSPAGTPRLQAGVLGAPGTSVLFGDQEINGDSTSGIRIDGGFWFTPQSSWGIEGEIIALQSQGDGFTSTAANNQIVARPVFNILIPAETAQLIDFPGVANGSLSVSTGTEFKSYLINARAALMPTTMLPCDACQRPDRLDWIVGYRRMELDDSVGFSQSIQSLESTVPGTIAVQESFRTSNQFNGLQLGTIYQANFQRVWFESMLRVGIGSNTQTVNIAGNTTITEFGVSETFNGGLLAQRSNIGSYERNQFTMVPEAGVTFGFRLTRCLNATVGYSALYFPNVARAGDQIDRDLNPNLIPEEIVPFSGPLRPGFRFVESDYWAHGLNLGAELRF